MIDPKDLMIKNWVYEGELTQFPMYVIGIGTDYVYLDFEGREGDLWDTTPENIQGIPVTDVLLEKIGFRKRILAKASNGTDDWIDYLYDCKNFHLAVCYTNGYACDKKWHIHIDNSDFISLGGGYFSYLHELQNLVKVIARQELKINL